VDIEEALGKVSKEQISQAQATQRGSEDRIDTLEDEYPFTDGKLDPKISDDAQISDIDPYQEDYSFQPKAQSLGLPPVKGDFYREVATLHPGSSFGELALI